MGESTNAVVESSSIDRGKLLTIANQSREFQEGLINYSHHLP